MRNLNLKHLRYFWAVASNGSIARASEVLHLTPQTISGQLAELEKQVGAKLFEKVGRNLALTDTGRVVFGYADEMFRLSNELQDVLAGRAPGSRVTLNVGIAMVVPKLLAYRVLAPVLSLEDPVLLVCNEAPLVDLLADLSVHKLDLVLADSPVSPTLNIRAYNHLLGESGISFFARESDAHQYREHFPESLDGAPMLMPTASSALRLDRAQLLVDLYRGGDALPDITWLIERARARDDAAAELEAQQLLANAHYSLALDREGYADFAAIENAALTAAARFFRGGRWHQPYLEWLSRLLPHTPPAETAERLARGEALTPEMAAMVEDISL